MKSSWKESFCLSNPIVRAIETQPVREHSQATSSSALIIEDLSPDKTWNILTGAEALKKWCQHLNSYLPEVCEDGIQVWTVNDGQPEKK